MKKPLLIGVSALILLASASFLFAQTTTGSSLITQMKAAVHAFTLAGDLNPGVTGLESSPLVGKRTGDMLSAGEYNRLLELVGQGGGGGFTTTVFQDITPGDSIKSYTCPNGQYVLSATTISAPAGDYVCGVAISADKRTVSYNACNVITGNNYYTDIVCGGGGGGGGGSGGLKMCAGNDVSCQTNGLIGMKCEVLSGVNIGKFENPDQWHYSGVAMKVISGKWYGSFPEYQNAGHFANVACDRVVVYDPSASGAAAASVPQGTLCGSLFTRRYGLNTTTCDSISSLANCAGQTLSVPTSCGTNPCGLMTGCPSGYAPIQTSYSWGGGQTMQDTVYAYHQCSCAKQ